MLSSSCAAEKKQHAAVLWNEQRLLCCRSKTRHTIAPHCITQKHLTIYCRQLQEIIASVTVHRVPKKLSMHDDADPFVRTTRVGRYQKKHSPTHTHPDYQTSFINFSIYNDPWHPLCSVYELNSPLGQPLSRSSLVFLLALGPQLHTPCISSPNHHHLFAAHSHTNAACFAAIPML